MPKGVEFWKQIGETLRQQRIATGHQTPQSYKRAHHDAPNERTITAIEVTAVSGYVDQRQKSLLADAT